jgi:hypothetical protein
MVELQGHDNLNFLKEEGMTMISKCSITVLKIFFGLLSFSMIILVIMTSLQSNMFKLPAVVVNEPWFKTTLVDFYFNICVISAWTIYREANALRATVWIIAFVFLGSIATCFYVLIQLCQWRVGDHFKTVLLPQKENAQ